MPLPQLLALVVLCAASGVVTGADEKPAPPPDYVRLSAEIRGTLHMEKDTARVHVFLGGTCLVVFYDTWDLDFGKNQELKASAAKLNGKTVLVSGTFSNRPFIGFGGKTPDPRQVLFVKTLSSAPTK
ncbi:MAG: hypothetical protein FJ304_14625 [Planctomycetes bacterium]|nr:hypothetical protein [Planctomycetota bacterium]